MEMVKRYVEFIEGRDPEIVDLDKTIHELEEEMQKAIADVLRTISIIKQVREQRLDKCCTEEIYLEEFLETV